MLISHLSTFSILFEAIQYLLLTGFNDLAKEFGPVQSFDEISNISSLVVLNNLILIKNSVV